VLLLPLSQLMEGEFIEGPRHSPHYSDGRDVLRAAIVKVYQLDNLEQQAWVRYLVNDTDARVLYVLDGLDEVQPNIQAEKAKNRQGGRATATISHVALPADP
jgi:hypothetical protein